MNRMSVIDKQIYYVVTCFTRIAYHEVLLVVNGYNRGLKRTKSKKSNIFYSHHREYPLSNTLVSMDVCY